MIVRHRPDPASRPAAGLPLVSVVTPSVPERAGMLEQACASVQAQTCRDWEHLVLVDSGYVGCARTVNRLAEEAIGKWLFILADDDLLHPGCLQAHLDAAEDGLDIIYGPPNVEGEDPGTFHGEPPGIPSASLIRWTMWEYLRGYDERLGQREDRDLYERAQGLGYQFARIPDGYWTYRFHGANKSRGQTFGPQHG
jgi:glycosyltransferase involved in cell wall biosynthesis